MIELIKAGTKKSQRRSGQRDAAGTLVYRPGAATGGTSPDSDLLARQKRPKNEAEALLFDQMTAEGWTLTKTGWPDFFCTKDGQICLVEVKPREGHPLKVQQAAVMGLLASYGVPCFLWTPDGGFEQMNPPQASE